MGPCGTAVAGALLTRARCYQQFGGVAAHAVEDSTSPTFHEVVHHSHL